MKLNNTTQVIRCFMFNYSLETRGVDSDNPLTLDEVGAILHDLQENYYEEYRIYEMFDLAVGAVVPLVSSLVNSIS